MRAIVFAVLAIAACGRKADPPSAADEPDSFAARRARHHTKLVRKGPAPQQYLDEAPPPGVELVKYRSGELELKAWYAHPPGGKRVPALVYFHGGYAFGADDFEVVRPFLAAGFAVMTPMVRGENGNPGEFEQFYGEVDDARAALAWMRARDDVDAAHVYAFGHSAGGVLVALVSFYDDTGLRLAGDADGLYDTNVLAGNEPYDPNDAEEKALRVPAPNGDQFRVPHVGYVGDADAIATKGAEATARAARRAKAKLEVETVPGNHLSSLEPAVKRFLERVQRDIATP